MYLVMSGTRAEVDDCCNSDRGARFFFVFFFQTRKTVPVPMKHNRLLGTLVPTVCNLSKTKPNNPRRQFCYKKGNKRSNAKQGFIYRLTRLKKTKISRVPPFNNYNTAMKNFEFNKHSFSDKVSWVSMPNAQRKKINRMFRFRDECHRVSTLPSLSTATFNLQKVMKLSYTYIVTYRSIVLGLCRAHSS